MRLRRLTINALPGITPGFTFEPPDADVTIITGPNAIGKSSLARALKHLLGDADRRDPPALSLEAEFDSGKTRWLVSRNGRQIQWMHDGEVAAAPALPTGDQINLYRLSMESLLADDQDDKALAETIWRALRGGFDLDAPRIVLSGRWARTEERALLQARNDLGEVERRYAALQADEAKLPELDERIEAADQARERLNHLQQALALHQAIEQRKQSQAAIDRFSADMAKLKGDELQRLRSWDSRAERLIEKRKEQQRHLAEVQRKQEAVGLQAAVPEQEQLARIEGLLQSLSSKVSERRHAQDATVKAQADLSDALAQLEGNGEPPNLGTEGLERARKIVQPLVDAQARLREFQQQLSLIGEPPDESEVDQLRNGVEALRTWLASSGQSDETTRNVPPLTYAALALAAIAALAAFVEQAFWTLAGVVAAGAAMLWTAVTQAMPTTGTGSPADQAKRRFETTDLDPPNEWSEVSVREHLRHNVERRLNALLLQQRQAEGEAKLRAQAQELRMEIERLNAQKAELATEIGIDPELTGAPFHRFIAVTSTWDKARSHCEEQNATLNQVETEVAEQANAVREFLDQWRAADAPPFDASGSDSAIEQLRIAWRALHKRLQATNDAQHEVESCKSEIRSLESQIADIDNDVRSLFNDVALDAEQRDKLADRIAHLAQWNAAGQALRDAKRDEGNLRTALTEHDDLVAAVEGGEVERLEEEQAIALRTAEAYQELIEERKGITTRLEEAGRSHDLEQAASVLDGTTATLEDKRDETLRHQATEVLLDEVEGQFTSEHEPDLLRRARDRFEQVTAPCIHPRTAQRQSLRCPRSRTGTTEDLGGTLLRNPHAATARPALGLDRGPGTRRRVAAAVP